MRLNVSEAGPFIGPAFLFFPLLGRPMGRYPGYLLRKFRDVELIADDDACRRCRLPVCRTIMLSGTDD